MRTAWRLDDNLWDDDVEEQTNMPETEVERIMSAWGQVPLPFCIYRISSEFVVQEAEHGESGYVAVPEWLLGGYVVARNKHRAKCELVSWTNRCSDAERGDRIRITDEMTVELVLDGVLLPQQVLQLMEDELHELFAAIAKRKETN
jgi:hypothetical protein